MLDHIEYLPAFNSYPDEARKHLLDYLNSLIDKINEQEGRIKQLEQQNKNLDHRTSGLIVIGSGPGIM
jgi:hypothetical protein